MDLVDEEDDVRAGASFFDQYLHTLLELAPILRPSDEPGHRHLNHPLTLEGQGCIGTDEPLGQTLHDARLAYPGLTHQDGVAFALLREHAGEAAHLLAPSNDRVEFAVTRQLGEVAPEASQEWRWLRVCPLLRRRQEPAELLQRIVYAHLGQQTSPRRIREFQQGLEQMRGLKLRNGFHCRQFLCPCEHATRYWAAMHTSSTGDGRARHSHMGTQSTPEQGLVKASTLEHPLQALGGGCQFMVDGSVGPG